VSATATDGLQTLAFGQLEAGLWGCVVADGGQGIAALGSLSPANSATATCAVTIAGASDSEEWTIAGRAPDPAGLHISLTVAAASPAATAAVLPGFEQLCHVRGRAVLDDGTERAIDFLGLRAVRGGLDVSQVDSVREVSAWFEPDEGLSLTAVRPRGVRGHDRDTLTAAVFDAEGVSEVEDPRLSTTYGRDALPLRAGLELWLAATEGEEQPYPRRAAADALGAGTRLSHAGLDVQARPLHWRSRGLEGAGLYLLARAG
jgi:hypothetical protein